MARPDETKRRTPRGSSPRTTARRVGNTGSKAAASSSKETPGTAKPSKGPAPIAALDATDHDPAIDDVTEEELRQSITGYAIMDICRPHKHDGTGKG